MPNPKITYIGAGSSVFAARVITDLVATPGLDGGTFALVDLDAERLDLSRRITEKVVKVSGKDWEVQTSTDREELLPGTDYLINSIEVAGLACVEPDYEIPLKYGVDQCIGDTIGPGGIFKALRTGPDWLAIVADTQRLAPNAVVMNYTNPMSILTLAADRTADLSVVGLCHSVQGTSRLLAGFLDVPYEELEWRCAGINHNAWFTKLAHDGQDLYPRLREIIDADPEGLGRRVRVEIFRRFGFFPTESSEHSSEHNLLRSSRGQTHAAVLSFVSPCLAEPLVKRQDTILAFAYWPRSFSIARAWGCYNPRLGVHVASITCRKLRPSRLSRRHARTSSWRLVNHRSRSTS